MLGGVADSPGSPSKAWSVAAEKFSSPCCESSGLQISAAWIEKCGGVCKLLHAIAWIWNIEQYTLHVSWTPFPTSSYIVMAKILIVIPGVEDWQIYTYNKKKGWFEVHAKISIMALTPPPLFKSKPSSQHVYSTLPVTPLTSPCPTLSADAEPARRDYLFCAARSVM